MTENTTLPETIIACDPTAIAPENREQHAADSRKLFAAVQEVRDTNTGFAFRLPVESELLVLGAEFIASERLCCPFFGFGLRIEANNVALWLDLTGDDDVKHFIRSEISTLLSDSVAQAAGLR